MTALVGRSLGKWPGSLWWPVLSSHSSFRSLGLCRVTGGTAVSNPGTQAPGEDAIKPSPGSFICENNRCCPPPISRRVPECVGILGCLGDCSGFQGDVAGRTGQRGCSGGGVGRTHSEVSVFHGLMLLSGWSPEVGSLKLMKEFAAFMGGWLCVGTEHRSLQTACGQQGRASVPVA